MPKTGHGGSGDYMILRALENWLGANAIQISYAQLSQLYESVKAKHEASPESDPILDKNGSISRSFIKDFSAALQSSGDNNTPSELSGGMGPGSTPSATDFGSTPPPPPPEDDEGLTPAQKKAKQDAKFNRRTGFQSILQIYGLVGSSNLTSLIQEATRQHYDQNTFLYYLRQTPEYQDRFTGIMNADGTLKMTEAEYLSTEKQYQDIGSATGLNVGPGLMGWLFSNDVSAAEFQDRAPAVRQLKSNPEYYQQFGKALQQLGIAGKDEVSKAELLKYVMNEGNAEWYKVENLLTARYAATQAGFKIRKDASDYFALNPGVIAHIARKGFDANALAQGFQAVGEGARTVLPTQEAVLYGVNKKDLTTAAFGGKGSLKSQNQIDRATKTAEAFGDERAGATVAQDSEGGFRIYGAGMQRRKA